MGVDPTKETAATSGSSSSASTASLSPLTTVKAPSGRPACFHRAATNSEGEGSRSLGLRMNVFPQAIATGYIHIGTIAGKLNGVMPATTPSGSRNENVSTPVETWSEYSPLRRCGIPQANSTTSRPRCTSPRASDRTLPCSSVINSAIRSAFALTSSRNANRTFDRRLSDACDHSSKAAAAERTAAPTSSELARSTSACCSPVAGFHTGADRAFSVATGRPSIQCPIVRMDLLLQLWMDGHQIRPPGPQDWPNAGYRPRPPSD